MSGPITLSVVVPVRNEEAVLPELHRRLLQSIAATPGGFEIIYVDDGSTDRTRQTARAGMRARCASRFHPAEPQFRQGGGGQRGAHARRAAKRRS